MKEKKAHRLNKGEYIEKTQKMSEINKHFSVKHPADRHSVRFYHYRASESGGKKICTTKKEYDILKMEKLDRTKQKKEERKEGRKERGKLGRVLSGVEQNVWSGICGGGGREEERGGGGREEKCGRCDEK